MSRVSQAFWAALESSWRA